jgi:chemotaxis protein MotB
MAALGRRDRATNTWPGFVDALATLLLVIVFLLLIFVMAQFFLSHALSGRDSALDRLRGQVSELADLLALERRAQGNLKDNLAQMSAELQTSVALRDDLRATINAMRLSAEETEPARRTGRDPQVQRRGPRRVDAATGRCTRGRRRKPRKAGAPTV